MLASRRSQMAWGVLGAGPAAWFAVWMLVFPDLVKPYFAWDVHPRYAQAFIGAGYVVRTAFFLNAAREPDWQKLRWMVWCKLALTGTLLFATYRRSLASSSSKNAGGSLLQLLSRRRRRSGHEASVERPWRFVEARARQDGGSV